MKRLLIGVTLAVLAAVAAAQAQTYPSRPVTLIVPYPAGGPSDTLARVLADESPNGDNVAKFAMAVSTLGNVRTSTARAWTLTEYMKLISGLPWFRHGRTAKKLLNAGNGPAFRSVEDASNEKLAHNYELPTPTTGHPHGRTHHIAARAISIDTMVNATAIDTTSASVAATYA